MSQSESPLNTRKCVYKIKFEGNKISLKMERHPDGVYLSTYALPPQFKDQTSRVRVGNTNVFFGPAITTYYKKEGYLWICTSSKEELVIDLLCENVDPQILRDIVDQLNARWAWCLNDWDDISIYWNKEETIPSWVVQII